MVKGPSRALAAMKRAKCCFKCTTCKRQYKSDNQKSARSMRGRHLSEMHGGVRAMKVQQRNGQARAYAKLRRRAELDNPSRLRGPAAKAVDIRILCPIRRGEMFNATRQHFVEKGFPLSCIRRLQGYDLKGKLPKRFAGMKSNHCCMAAFALGFLPQMKKRFALNSHLKFAVWAEDDARLHDGVDAQAILQACEEAAPAACLLGWCSTRPEWGSHFAAFTPESLVAVEECLKSNYEYKFVHGVYYLGKHLALDTFWARIWKEKGHYECAPKAKILSRARGGPLACQHTHTLKGRK